MTESPTAATSREALLAVTDGIPGRALTSRHAEWYKQATPEMRDAHVSLEHDLSGRRDETSQTRESLHDALHEWSFPLITGLRIPDLPDGADGAGPFYVMSAHPKATRAHLTVMGRATTACGAWFTARCISSTDPPQGARECQPCARRAVDLAWIPPTPVVPQQARPKLDRASSPTTQRILKMLVEGMTDKEIGARLGISERSLSRYVSEAMQQAGARTRFQWAYALGSASAKTMGRSPE